MLGSWIGRVLREYEDAGSITAKSIAAAAGVDRQTAYNWLSGTHSPSSDHLPDLVAHLPRAVGEAILAALATALPSRLEDGLDANQDGRVDARDAVMVGDSEENDGAARELGCGFVLVDPLPTDERPTGLLDGLRERGALL